VVDAGADGLTVDLDYIEDALPRDRAAKEDRIRSLPIPEGTPWGEVTLEVDERVLKVMVAGRSWEVDAEEAGFADSRRKSGEGGQPYQILSLLALRLGRLDLNDLAKREKKTAAFQRQISTLRAMLCSLVPAEGEPIAWDAKEKAYVCSFKIRGAGDMNLPLPSDGSWMSYRIVEGRDGRIAVGVKANHRQRTRDVRTGQIEASERRETIWHEYSLVDLGLARDVDRLLPEGQAFIELLRSGGRLVRAGDDLAVLKLNKWLRDRTGLAGDPLRFSEATGAWIAAFDCSSQRRR
jgi:hypothetical protein